MRTCSHEALHRIGEEHGNCEEGASAVGGDAAKREVSKDIARCRVKEAEVSAKSHDGAKNGSKGDGRSGNKLPPPAGVVLEGAANDEGRVLAGHGCAEDAEANEKVGADPIAPEHVSKAASFRDGQFDRSNGGDKYDENDIRHDRQEGPYGEGRHVPLHGEGNHYEKAEED